MEFKKEEIRDLIISIIGLTLLSGIFDFKNVIIYFIVYAISTIFKLLAQKYTAKKYELDVTYDFNYNFFIISLVLGIFSFGQIIFPILGFINPVQKPIKRIGKAFSNITLSEKGWISVMGIVSNVFLIIVSSIFFNMNPMFFQKMININLLIMIFSLIPYAKFDGSAILWWNRFLWIALLICSIIFSILTIYNINIIISLIFLAIIFVLIFVFWENSM